MKSNHIAMVLIAVIAFFIVFILKPSDPVQDKIKRDDVIINANTSYCSYKKQYDSALTYIKTCIKQYDSKSLSQAMLIENTCKVLAYQLYTIVYTYSGDYENSKISYDWMTRFQNAEIKSKLPLSTGKIYNPSCSL